jgi:predicted nuclease of predicted toxin-antitoxin system
VKFLVDEDLSEEIASILRAGGLDAVHVRDLGLSGAEDQEVLDEAARQKRCVVTRNRNDFLMLTEFYFHEGRPHHGVLIVPRSYPGNKASKIAQAIISLTQNHPDAFQPYAFLFL